MCQPPRNYTLSDSGQLRKWTVWQRSNCWFSQLLGWWSWHSVLKKMIEYSSDKGVGIQVNWMQKLSKMWHNINVKFLHLSVFVSDKMLAIRKDTMSKYSYGVRKSRNPRPIKFSKPNIACITRHSILLRLDYVTKYTWKCQLVLGMTGNNAVEEFYRSCLYCHLLLAAY